MSNKKLRALIFSAFMAALACVATMIIQIPSPMNGYVNLGDGVVLLSAWMLSPAYAAAASGLGSALADILTGYAYYAPCTFIAKGATALVAALLFRVIKKHMRFDAVNCAISGAVGESIMVLCYFVYAYIFLGNGISAATSIPGNIVQGIAGIIVSILIYTPLSKLIDINKFFN